MASSSTSSVHKSFKYDVFLSFRGEDTRKNFIDHLYYALQQKSISTYKDDEKIKKGKRISDELKESIADSKFFIIVFSKNYASSSWCLNELLKIMECQKTNDHTVYPVFYDVEPSEIRNQIGAVGEAFAKHENEEAAGKWRKALKEVADVAGWELKNTDGHEAKFIRQIVEKLSLELRAINVRIDKNLVGMETRINDIISSLGTASDDVHMIGIWGIGGGGKTTLARAVYNKISFQFEGKSFIENVREVSKASLNSLQSQIPLNGGKVLLVLDDVDHLNQLEVLAGDPSWFKPRSIIIITTRDEQVLVAHGVKLIHNVNLLSDKEAIWLFSRYAFGKEIPVQGYEELSRQVVCYAAGLPLTIKVLGSFLCGKSKPEWVDALARLKTIPLEETQKKLELSYIGLDEEHKEIFLDVATILKGWLKNSAIGALESCGFYARIGLRVLEQKSLITIDGERLGMHDHLQEMGRNIVRRSNPPNKHSRLWDRKEIEDILANDMGTKATRCMKFYYRGLDRQISMKGLRKMTELWFLDVADQEFYSNRDINKIIPNFLNALGFLCCNWKFNEVHPYFPDALRYLRWDGYNFSYLPKSFQANNLVSLEMSYSDIVQLWERGEKKVLNKLRFLHLHGKNLRTFDLGLTPNLETLTLQSNGYGSGLVELYMPGECLKLRSLNIYGVKLRMFDLGLTPNLEKLWLSGGDLVELHMPHTCLNLTSLHLSLSNLRTLDIRLTPNLEDLDVANCYDLEELHMTDECLKLRSLHLVGLKLRTLDIGLTPNLKSLDLHGCNDLEEFHIGECSMLTFIKIECLKLRTLDLSLVPNLNQLFLSECKSLVELHLPHRCINLDTLQCIDLKLRTLDIGLTPNLSALYLKDCYDLEQLQLVDQCQKLVSLKISHSKLRILDLGLTPNIKKLDLRGCYSLLELHAPVECLKDIVALDLTSCLGFSSLSFYKLDDGRVNELVEGDPLAVLHFTLQSCPFHPENHLPEFEFKSFHKEDLLSLTRSIEKLISEGLCACTKLETFSRSICELQR
ncbi:disease resistance protein RPV1 [Lactuca sativa]|uniref:disease resistance protein RPV1 n=1 Tax=Lactuca sativa TaxID=4236 RepID=UPI000CD92349|nr:disease resistance protein RPV1 [Lactuca sativa]